MPKTHIQECKICEIYTPLLEIDLDEMMDLLHTVEQSPKVATTAQIDQKQEEMDAHDENNSNKKDIPFHYSNKICFLSSDDFDYMVAAKHEAEEAIGWKLLPENIVYRVEKMCPIQTKWGSRCILHLRNAMGQNIKVWAPNNLVRDLKTGFKLNGRDSLAFIKSLGEKETNVIGEPKKKFFDFETVYLPL